MCKKVPSEIAIVKIDSLHNKVKLLSPSFFSKELHPKTPKGLLRIIANKASNPPLSPQS
jgi:hypothetical protein